MAVYLGSEHLGTIYHEADSELAKWRFQRMSRSSNAVRSNSISEFAHDGRYEAHGPSGPCQKIPVQFSGLDRSKKGTAEGRQFVEPARKLSTIPAEYKQ